MLVYLPWEGSHCVCLGLLACVVRPLPHLRFWVIEYKVNAGICFPCPLYLVVPSLDCMIPLTFICFFRIYQYTLSVV